VGVYNLDDENVEYFLAVPVKNKYGYGTKLKIKNEKLKIDYELMITNCELTPQGTKFTANNVDFEMKLLGEFNIYNAAAAICLALSRGISMEKIKEALIRAKPVPGRMEVIDKGQDFTVVVDYAHEPVGLEQVYQSIKIFHPSKIIALLGAQGGGRDKSKRAVLGEIAGQYADYVIVTNEDPYDDDPMELMGEVAGDHKFEMILDRRQAIRLALEAMKSGETLVITGKGAEPWIMGSNGLKIPWDDRRIVREEWEKIK